MVTLLHASGVSVHIGESRNVNPSIRTLRELTSRNVNGRSSSLTTPLCCRFHHTCPRASTVPRPTSETFSRSSPQNIAACRCFTPGPSHLLDHIGNSPISWLPRSVAPGCTSRVMLLLSHSVPVTYCPGGTSTVPPPLDAAASMAA